MRSGSLFTYFPLVLSFGIGALAQAEVAKCLAGWEWVRFFPSLAVFGRAEDIFVGAPKSKQEIKNNIQLPSIVESELP